MRSAKIYYQKWLITLTPLFDNSRARVLVNLNQQKKFPERSQKKKQSWKWKRYKQKKLKIIENECLLYAQMHKLLKEGWWLVAHSESQIYFIFLLTKEICCQHIIYQLNKNTSFLDLSWFRKELLTWNMSFAYIAHICFTKAF